MTAEERETFLAGVHVGILAVERDGRAPLAVPVWYDYVPGGEILIWIHRETVKDKVIRKAGRFTLAVHTEDRPYRYVTAEGPVVSGDEVPTREQALRIAGRYLSEEGAREFLEGSLSEDSLLVRMRPEKWLSTDHSKN
jgi:nitroimidazol reductase NimA-like FMN-containing flavoprotein (pyridoxamine 5'-phosphate oxidase superfamily)